MMVGEGIPKAWGRFPAVLGLLLADLLAIENSLLLGYATREYLFGLFPAQVPPGALTSIAWALLFFPLGYFLAGLYPGYGLAAVERVRRKVQATFLLFLALIAWEWLFFREGWSRGVLVLSLGYALVLVPLGAARTGALVARALLREKALGLRPIGFWTTTQASKAGGWRGFPSWGVEAAEEWTRRGVRVAVPKVGPKKRPDARQIQRGLSSLLPLRFTSMALQQGQGTRRIVRRTFPWYILISCPNCTITTTSEGGYQTLDDSDFELAPADLVGRKFMLAYRKRPNTA